MLVDLARGDVILSGEGNIEIAFAETNQRFGSVERLGDRFTNFQDPNPLLRHHQVRTPPRV